jgi:hypothetical protein
MLKSKVSFITVTVLLFMGFCCSFGGDIIVLIKQTLDERVEVLERKVALYDAYFAAHKINLEQTYGPHLLFIREDINTTIQSTNIQPTNPREAGRYMVRLKNGIQMIAITFEQTTVKKKSFDKGTISTEYYIFHTENGKQIKHPCKDVESIQFNSFGTN